MPLWLDVHFCQVENRAAQTGPFIALFLSALVIPPTSAQMGLNMTQAPLNPQQEILDQAPRLAGYQDRKSIFDLCFKGVNVM